jgi:hypothetical protein
MPQAVEMYMLAALTPQYQWPFEDILEQLACAS